MKHWSSARRASRTPVVTIVDDRALNLTIYSKLVEAAQNGVTLQTFRDPSLALEWLLANEADLVISDYNMTGMNGAAFTTRLRRLPLNAEVPVIVITAKEDRASRLNSLDAGATDFLKSPVDHAEFLTRVRNLLKMSWQHKVIRERASVLEREVLSMRASIRHQSRVGDRLQQLRGSYREPRADIRAIGYEPLVCLSTGGIVGWQAVSVPPLDSQETPLRALGALSLDAFPRALRTVCRDGGRWFAAGQTVVVTLGLDIRDIRQPGIVNRISDDLSEGGLQPAFLQLEVASSTLCQLDDVDMHRLGQVRALGVKLAVLDQGILPAARLATGIFQMLKIDAGISEAPARTGARSDALRAISDFAQALGMSLAAAGVHTQNDITRARNHGCRVAQGPYFSVPILAPEVLSVFSGWIASRAFQDVRADAGEKAGRRP